MSDGPGGGGSGADGMTTTPSIDLTTWMHLVDTLPGGAALVSDDWRIVHANAPLCHDCMRQREDLVGTSLLDLVTHRPSKAAQPTDFPPAERQRYELVGGSRRLRLEATLLALSAPCDEAAFLWFVHDSSVVDEFAVSGLEASEKGFALALKGAADGIWEWNPVTKKLFLSPRLLNILGYPEDFRVQTTDEWLDLVHPDDRARYSEANTRHLHGETPHFECEYRIRRADGTWAWGLSRGIAAFDEDGVARRMAGSITDISERKHQEELIQFLATRDSLTTLANRFLLAERLAEMLTRARASGGSVAVVYMDLDFFKNINDSMGHQAGDKVLIEIARRLREEFPDPAVVARQGGDEFIIAIPQAPDLTQVGGRIGRLLENLRRPIHMITGELSVRASAGIAFYPHEGDDATTLLKNADLALYAAKERGRGQFAFFSSDMAEYARERMNLERHLAVATEKGEFYLDFQPQVELPSGRIVGCEALLRWRHPELGSVSPGRFIPVAESSGLILPIGAWVLDHACRQAAAWRDQGLALPVAVNLSVAQLTHSNFVQTVVEALGRHRLTPDLIELEITESLLMDGGSEALGTLDELARLGISLAVDDFGTGYSSLAYLKRLPIDRLKIDRSFVSSVHTDRSDAAVVRAIIAIAQELELSVVAEGIESAEQAQALADLGCRYAQGYFFGRPMAPRALFDRVSSHCTR